MKVVLPPPHLFTGLYKPGNLLLKTVPCPGVYWGSKVVGEATGLRAVVPGCGLSGNILTA